MEDAVSLFLDYIRFEKNYSLHTIRSYARDLAEFREYLGRGEKEDVSPRNIDHITIRDFLGHLYRKGNNKASVSRKLAALRSFFRFLHGRGLLDSNPARLVRSPKLPRSNPDFLSVRDVEKVVQAPDLETDKGVRDRAILELLYGTGIRVSELVALNTGDISLPDRLVKVKGKGRKERIIPFGAPARKSLEAYLPVRGNLLRRKRSVRQPDALFLNLRGNRLSVRSIQRLVDSYVRSAALSRSVFARVRLDTLLAWRRWNGTCGCFRNR